MKNVDGAQVLTVQVKDMVPSGKPLVFNQDLKPGQIAQIKVQEDVNNQYQVQVTCISKTLSGPPTDEIEVSYTINGK
jgi:hypothetical protein